MPATVKARIGATIPGKITFSTSPSPWIALVPLAAKAGDAFADPSYASVASGAYPLSSYLQFHVNRVPGKPLEPWIKAYLENALSDEGQALVTAQRGGEGGYVPLSAADLARERRKLEKM